MNPTVTRMMMVMGLLFGLSAVGCGDPDAVASYCNRYNYCFEDYDTVGCLEDRAGLEELAVGQGDECHAAFLSFHDCIGELSCSDLDDYLADNAHCGTAFNVWQNRCPVN